MELGATEAGKGVIRQIRTLLPGVWIAGVEKQLHYESTVFDHVITNQFDAFYGRYPEIDTSALSISPELYSLMRPYEGKLLNVTGLASVRSTMDYPEPIRGVPVFEDSYDSRKDLLDRHVRYWNYVLDKYEIDAIFHENLGQEVFDYVALVVARTKGIPSLVFNISGQFPRVLFVQESEHGLGDLQLGRTLKQRIGVDLSEEDPRFIRRSLPAVQNSPDAGLLTLRSQSSNTEYKTSPFISWLFDRSIYKNDVTTLLVIRALGRKLWRVIKNPVERLRVFRRSRDLLRSTRASMREEEAHSETPDFHVPYIYFPLHFQPETSTSIKGRHFYTLREAVAFLAGQLPTGWKLIVKEHPHQFRRLLKRVPGFYSQIAAIPNVVLVSHLCENDALVKHARAVACVSHSSITAHAVLSGKPVISLGDSHFREAPNYFCITSADDLQEIMTRVAINDFKADRLAMEGFITKLEGSTFEGEFGERPDDLSESEWNRTMAVTAINIGRVIVEWLKLRQLAK